jgi:hypothetical protein
MTQTFTTLYLELQTYGLLPQTREYAMLLTRLAYGERDKLRSLYYDLHHPLQPIVRLPDAMYTPERTWTRPTIVPPKRKTRVDYKSRGWPWNLPGVIIHEEAKK